jgi:HSP90 family molecular chaperone
MRKNSEKIVKKNSILYGNGSKKSLEKRKPDNYEEKKASLEKLKEREKGGELKIYYAEGSAMSMEPHHAQKKGERIEVPCFRGTNAEFIWNMGCEKRPTFIFD